MKTNQHHSVRRHAESGQAIIFVALLMVALLGILGVAIDGGGLYFLRRDTQNAADAAVMAATYAMCTNSNPINAGMVAAAQNGFTNDGVNNTVAVNNPPTAGAAAGDEAYVEVLISANKPSYFIQLVYPGPLGVTTRAVGYCIPPFDPTTIPALFAGSSTCQNTIDWSGANVEVVGGMFSNNEIKISGGGQGNEIIGDSGAVNGIEGNNTEWYVDHDNNPSTPPIPTTPNGNAEPREDPLKLDIEDFAPGGTVARRAALYTAIRGSADDVDYKSNGTWDPGNNRKLEGLYYIEGNVNIGNGVIIDGDRNGDGKAQGITIVATGEVSFTADKGENAQYYIDGILVFTTYGEGRPCSANALRISGSEALNWRGVFYAPNGAVQASLSELNMVGAIIANTMNMSGSDLRLVYDPTILPPRPPAVEIAE